MTFNPDTNPDVLEAQAMACDNDGWDALALILNELADEQRDQLEALDRIYECGEEFEAWRYDSPTEQMYYMNEAGQGIW